VENPSPTGPRAPEGPVTELAVSELMPAVYEELRQLARRARFRLSGGDTLTTTALIHEAYVRLSNAPGFRSRGDFLRVAAVAMRRILVDRVRTQFAAKRGGGARRAEVEVEDVAAFEVEDGDRVLAVHEALQRLSEMSPRLAGLVECRFFAGYSEPETALALGVSERTVQRDWTLARAWLKKELSASPASS
jgi:RNA polymerase sigma factor (TIGR02999 family)